MRDSTERDLAVADELGQMADARIKELEAQNNRLSTGLENLYHLITGKHCDRYVALGMATSAVSGLIARLSEVEKERDRAREDVRILTNGRFIQS